MTQWPPLQAVALCVGPAGNRAMTAANHSTSSNAVHNRTFWRCCTQLPMMRINVSKMWMRMSRISWWETSVYIASFVGYCNSRNSMEEAGRETCISMIWRWHTLPRSEFEKVWHLARNIITHAWIWVVHIQNPFQGHACQQLGTPLALGLLFPGQIQFILILSDPITVCLKIRDQFSRFILG